MTKLAAVLNIPLTMAKFLNLGDLAKRARAERKFAADAFECIDAHLLRLEAEHRMLNDGGDIADANISDARSSADIDLFTDIATDAAAR